MVATLALCVITIHHASGQKDATAFQADVELAVPAYEIVSIKQTRGDPNFVGIQDLPDGFSMNNLTLGPLISYAYGVVLDKDITGWPGWSSSIRFDVQAKMDVETANGLHKLPAQQQEAQRRLMMQSLLAERFKLKVHRETAVRTTYELVLARGKPKLKEDNPSSNSDGTRVPEGTRPRTDWEIADGKITGHAMPISILTAHLEGPLETGVVDKTGLTSRYDVVLKWDATGNQNPNSTEPSIFTALEEQLGFRLKPIKTAVETIVIDHLEMPSAN